MFYDSFRLKYRNEWTVLDVLEAHLIPWAGQQPHVTYGMIDSLQLEENAKNNFVTVLRDHGFVLCEALNDIDFLDTRSKAFSACTIFPQQ